LKEYKGLVLASQRFILVWVVPANWQNSFARLTFVSF